ncbi:MAG: SpaA isopeptide-forming pilin-related protein [Peptoniphilaceae bacterium]
MEKISKKIISMALLLGLVLSIFSPVVARAEQAKDGQITVKNALKDKKYNLYRVFDLSFNEDVGAYTYTVANKDFEDILFSEYQKLKKVNGQGNPITNKDGKIIIDAEPLRNGTINPYDFSIWLQDKTTNFVKEGNELTATSDNDTSIVWSGLQLGYYMVKSDAGTVVSLTTTDKTADVYEKNIMPKLTKQVKGGTATDFADLTYANIGEELEFKITFDVHNHANTVYTLKDIVPKGIDVTDNNSVSVTIAGQDITLYDNGTVPSPVPENAYPYEVNKKFTDGTTDGTKELEIKFPLKTIQAIADSIRTDDNTVDESTKDTKKTITITYKGKLNNNANMSNHTTFSDDNVNRNNAELAYDPSTSIDPITADADVRTTEFQIKKFAIKDGNEQVLENAKFKIYTEEENSKGTAGTPLKFSKFDTGENYIYNSEGTVTEITTTTSGLFSIKGLKTGTYYIEESAAPDGFNPLQKRVKLEIGADNETTPTKLVYEATIADPDTATLEDNIVKIENKSGAELPETGGMGRTIIYTAGAVIFFGALVLLIARKRSGQDRA